ncbi:MarR family transcriptional regulator [Rhodococcus aetherivorans]
MTRHGSRDLVRVLGLQSSNVSATVRSLVQLGLVARTSNPATDGPTPCTGRPRPWRNATTT